MTIRVNDRVKVRGCQGTAQVVSHLRKYNVYLLDRQMTDKNGVSYWTWEKKDLIKLEKKLVRRF